MARTQILVHSLGPKQGFWRCFADEFGPCYCFYFLFKTFVSTLINFIGHNGRYWVASSCGNPIGFLSKTKCKKGSI